jgi:hypothetical protein
MEVEIGVTFGTTTTTGGGATWSLSLPSGYTIDTAKVGLTTTAGNPLGVVIGLVANTTYYSGHVTYSNTGAVALFSNSVTSGWNSTQPATWTATSNNYFTARFKVPILGWSSSVVMSSDAATNVVAARIYKATNQTAIGPNGSGVKLTFDTASYDKQGAWASNKYTVQVSGVYDIQANLVFLGTNVLANGYFAIIYKNGNIYSYGAPYYPAVSTIFGIAAFDSLDLVAGDYIEIGIYGIGNNSVNTLTLDGGVTDSWVSIRRISGPAQIAASESVSALYTGAPPTGTLTNAYNTTTFATKVKDTHSAYASGIYTVPVSGVYDISASTDQLATYALNKVAITAIFIDGVNKYAGRSFAGGANAELTPQVNVKSVPLLAGQLVTIRSYNDATTPTFQNDATLQYFSIVRTGNY